MYKDTNKFDNFINASNIKHTYAMDKSKCIYLFNDFLDKYIFVIEDEHPGEIKLIIQTKYVNDSFEVEKIITFIRKIFDKIIIEEIYDIQTDTKMNMYVQLILRNISKNNTVNV